MLRQPDLARTLEHVASSGAPGFYDGPVAEAIVATVRAAGGVMTLSDLADYRPIWRPPVHGRFDGYNIYSMPPPSAGGGVLVTILNVLSTYDLTALEHNSPTYMHLLAEAMQFAFADRAALYGDPDFVDVPLAWLLSPARANQLRRRLSAATTFSPRFYGSRFAAGDRGTSHLSVIDSDGNAVACTTSVNTAFGSMLTAGDSGIILNNTMDDFSAQPGVPNVYGLIGAEANAVGPKKRPLSSMSPTIVTRDGKAVAVARGLWRSFHYQRDPPGLVEQSRLQPGGVGCARGAADSPPVGTAGAHAGRRDPSDRPQCATPPRAPEHERS